MSRFNRRLSPRQALSSHPFHFEYIALVLYTRTPSHPIPALN